MPWCSNVSLRGRIQAKDAWNLLRPARDTLSQILARCPTWLWFASRLAPISALLPRTGHTQCNELIHELMSQDTSRRLTHMEAIIEAIAVAMREDPRVFYIGQDVGAMQGSMQGTKGLLEEFGPTRIREAPISESAMVGAALGAALFGQRPIVEISFGEFLPAAMNQLINQAPNLHYMTGGTARLPVVVRTRVGDGPYGGHPQDYSAWFAHVPGWKVVMPATPVDAKGMMTAAIRDDGPVLFFEGMSLSHAARAPVPLDAFETSIGQARIAREGRDVTVVAVGSSLPL